MYRGRGDALVYPGDAAASKEPSSVDTSIYRMTEQVPRSFAGEPDTIMALRKTAAKETETIELAKARERMLAAQAEHRCHPKTLAVYPRPVFRSFQSAKDAELVIRQQHPIDSARADEEKACRFRAQLKHEAARLQERKDAFPGDWTTDTSAAAIDLREDDAEFAATQRRIDALEERARQTRRDDRSLYAASEAAYEQAMREQNDFLQNQIRLSIEGEKLSTEVLLNKADELQAIGQADTARLLRTSVMRDYLRGEGAAAPAVENLSDLRPI